MANDKPARIWVGLSPACWYVPGPVVGLMTCSEVGTALASAGSSSLFPLHRGFLVASRDPGPYVAQFRLAPAGEGFG